MADPQPLDRGDGALERRRLPADQHRPRVQLAVEPGERQRVACTTRPVGPSAARRSRRTGLRKVAQLRTVAQLHSRRSRRTVALGCTVAPSPHRVAQGRTRVRAADGLEEAGVGPRLDIFRHRHALEHLQQKISLRLKKVT